ncbi:MAG: PD-(D/E)XK nuclease family protein [Tepidisphaeraceae bacterium]|jgi:ATP-dependent helicase/nuclease subunit B
MSAQFIIGRAGAGKTHWCREQTLAACRDQPLGSAILWLVPRQATFQTQRDLCCGGGRQGFFRVRVLSFEQLCNQVLEETGAASAPQVTRTGRRILLGRFLRQRQGQLRFFKSAASHAGLAAEFDSALDELQRGGADVATLHTRLPQSSASDTLAEKIADLQLIFGDYTAFLGQQRLDPDLRLLLAMRSFDQCALLQNATVFIDGYLHFTQRERRLICSLARICPAVHVSLTMDSRSTLLANPHHEPDELGLFHSQETEYRKLYHAFVQDRIKIDPPLLFAQTRRFQTRNLTRLEQWLSSPAIAETSSSSAGVELIEAPDKRAEVDAAARRILELVANGHRYRDITLLVRQLDEYQDLLDAAFAEHRIPFFTDHRRGASHHPLIQFIRAAFSAAASPWHPDAMNTLIKTGLCGLTAAEADELENNLILRDIRRDAWTKIAAATTAETTPSAEDKLRGRIGELFSPFITALNFGPLTVRQICDSLFSLFERCGIRQTHARWIADAKASASHQQAQEHQQVWSELLALFRQLLDLLGDERLTLADFQATLDAALETFDLAIAPPTVDQLLVGQIDRTRPPAVKVAIILGLSNGQFPLSPPPQPIFSDADRDALAGVANLEPDTRRQALNEEFLGYFAFTRPSHLLIAMRPAADDSGRKLAPGSLWRKLQTRLGIQIERLAEKSDSSNPAGISTPRQLLSGLMRWARSPALVPNSPSPCTQGEGRGEGSSDSADGVGKAKGDPHPNPLPEYMERGQHKTSDGETAWPALYQWLAERAARSDDIYRLRRLAWPALKYNNDAKLSRTTAAQLFPIPLRTSAHQLEVFRACPFQHFARYGLQLSPRAAASSDAQQIAHACRHAMSRLLHKLLARQTDWCAMNPNQLRHFLHQLAVATAAEQTGASPPSARDRHLIDRIESALTQIVAAQKAASQRSEFRPADAAVRFGDSGRLPPLEINTPAGNRVLFSGEIDRVDLPPDGRAAIIYDYRMRAGALALAEVYHGLRLTQAVHLLAWSQAPHKTPSRPAAALTVPIRRDAQDKKPHDAIQPDDPRFVLQFKPRGIINEQFAPDMDSGMQPSRYSDVLALYVSKESEFGMRSRTDVAAPAEFNGLLNHARRILARLADEIVGGKIDVLPYKLGTQTPCSHCHYRDVCRFQTTDRHDLLGPMNRQTALKIMASI